MRTRDDLRPGQRALIKEMTEYPSGIAVLGVGGGKTASALTAYEDLFQQGRVDQAIALAPPKTLRTAWTKEPSKWEHLQHLEVRAIDGTPKQRDRAMRDRSWDVAVVSIDNTKWLVDWLTEEKWDLSAIQLFLDEITRYKGSNSKHARRLMTIAEDFAGVWGLTGTPRPNGYEDLFRPIRLVGGKDAWGIRSMDEWKREHFKPLDYHGYRWAVHDFMKPKLDRICQEWMVYAPTDDLDKPKLNIGEDFIRKTFMTPTQKKHYDELMEQLMTVVGADADAETMIEVFSQGALSGKLTQVIQGFMYDEDQEPHPLKENPKLDELMEMDKDLGGEAAVITYGFRAERDVLEKTLKKAGNRIGILGGGVTPKKAEQTVEAFSRGEIDRLLLHPASAGHGVDGLQFGGRHLIHHCPTWSAELYEQVIGRIDRPGQTQETFSWWIGMDQTTDEIKWARVHSKVEDQAEFNKILRRIT